MGLRVIGISSRPALIALIHQVSTPRASTLQLVSTATPTIPNNLDTRGGAPKTRKYIYCETHALLNHVYAVLIVQLSEGKKEKYCKVKEKIF